jgi:hypothetical protein
MKGIVNLILFVFVWCCLAIFVVGLVLFPVYCFLVFYGAGKRAEKAKQKLQSSLMEREEVITFALQKRLYALFARRQLIAITSSRMILIKRSVFGGFSMRDYQWKDLLDAQLSENIFPGLCGSNIRFKVNRDRLSIAVEGIISDVASEIYSYAQAREQEWEEKRRVRELEEKRAASGATVLHVGDSRGSAVAGASIFEDLERAKKLLDSGAISDAEYNEMKSKILNRNSF